MTPQLSNTMVALFGGDETDIDVFTRRIAICLNTTGSVSSGNVCH
jgi:hypothetical protein